MDAGDEYIADDLVKSHIGKPRKKIEADTDKPQLATARHGFDYVNLPAAR